MDVSYGYKPVSIPIKIVDAPVINQFMDGCFEGVAVGSGNGPAGNKGDHQKLPVIGCHCNPQQPTIFDFNITMKTTLKIIVWQASLNSSVWTWCVKVSHSGEDSLTCASWAPDGRRLAVVSKEQLHYPFYGIRRAVNLLLIHFLCSPTIQGGNRGQLYQCDTHGTVLDR